MQVHTIIPKFIFLEIELSLSTPQLKKRGIPFNEIKEHLLVIRVQVEKNNHA